MKLDDLLRDVAAPRSGALERARAAARAELKTGKPIGRWTAQLLRVCGATLGLVAAAGGVLLLAGQTDGGAISAHAVTLSLLGAVAVVTAIAALKPSAPRGWALVLAAVAAVLVVVLRPEGVGYSPEWVCTASQLAVGVLPLVVVVLQLRGAAPDPKRALIGGLSAGCTGAMLGELACSRGPLHVAEYHLPAWALVAVACVLIARKITPRSYAP